MMVDLVLIVGYKNMRKVININKKWSFVQKNVELNNLLSEKVNKIFTFI